MGAALEIVIIPSLVILAVIVLGLVANFSIMTVVVSAVVVSLLVFGVTMLLRKEKEWEGPPSEHEEHRTG